MSAQILEFQLDMFETPQDRMLRMRLEEIEHIAMSSKNSNDKVRKKVFASMGEMNKRVTDLEARLEILERNICRG